MSQNSFLQRKKSILSKSDKSSKGDWDKRIIGLCEKINRMGNYYTTSSCSGRVVLMINQDKKEEGLFLKMYHDLIRYDELKSRLEKIRKKSVKFKQEPPILHVVCSTLEDAFTFLKKARFAGFKRSGIISGGSRFVLEIMSTEKLEFPVINNKLLVSEEFLKLIVKKSNQNLKKGWKKIDELKRLI